MIKILRCGRRQTVEETANITQTNLIKAHSHIYRCRNNEYDNFIHGMETGDVLRRSMDESRHNTVLSPFQAYTVRFPEYQYRMI